MTEGEAMGTLAMTVACTGGLLLCAGLALRRAWWRGPVVAAVIGGLLLVAALGMALGTTSAPAAVPASAPAAPTVSSIAPGR